MDGAIRCDYEEGEINEEEDEVKCQENSSEGQLNDEFPESSQRPAKYSWAFFISLNPKLRNSSEGSEEMTSLNTSESLSSKKGLIEIGISEASLREQFKDCFISSVQLTTKHPKPTFISTKCIERKDNDKYNKSINSPKKYSERRDEPRSTDFRDKYQGPDRRNQGYDHHSSSRPRPFDEDRRSYQDSHSPSYGSNWEDSRYPPRNSNWEDSHNSPRNSNWEHSHPPSRSFNLENNHSSRNKGGYYPVYGPRFMHELCHPPRGNSHHQNYLDSTRNVNSEFQRRKNISESEISKSGSESYEDHFYSKTLSDPRNRKNYRGETAKGRERPYRPENYTGTENAARFDSQKGNTWFDMSDNLKRTENTRYHRGNKITGNKDQFDASKQHKTTYKSDNLKEFEKKKCTPNEKVHKENETEWEPDESERLFELDIHERTVNCSPIRSDYKEESPPENLKNKETLTNSEYDWNGPVMDEQNNDSSEDQNEPPTWKYPSGTTGDIVWGKWK